MAKPYPMAHDFEKLLSSARKEEPQLTEGLAVDAPSQQQGTGLGQYGSDRSEFVGRTAVVGDSRTPSAGQRRISL